MSLPGENVPENVTTAVRGKRAGDTSRAVVTGMKTITENAAESEIAIVRGIGTEIEKGRGRGSTDIASQYQRWVQHVFSVVFVLRYKGNGKTSMLRFDF